MMFALFKEVRKAERRKKRKLNHGGGANLVDSEESDKSEEGSTDQRMSMPNKAKMPVTLQHPQPSESQKPLAGVSAATRASSGPSSERWVPC